MPELPEVRHNVTIINRDAEAVHYKKATKSAVVTEQKHGPDFRPLLQSKFPNGFKIHADCRGKELQLHFSAAPANGKQPECETIVITYFLGMTGYFEIIPAGNSERHKHAHWVFDRSDGSALCFVDVRRFGTWKYGGFSEDRGPDPVQNYDQFRAHVLSSLQSKPKVFEKPICEVMLDQEIFNGVGNYLRAEIMHRAGVPPFISARNALQHLVDGSASKYGDILQLTRDICLEVIKMDLSYEGRSSDDEKTFINWLRCYLKPDAHQALDKQKRTVWWYGEGGDMKHEILHHRKKKEAGAKKTKKSQKKKDEDSEDGESEEEEEMPQAEEEEKEAKGKKKATPLKKGKSAKAAAAPVVEEEKKEAPAKAKRGRKQISKVEEPAVAEAKQEEVEVAAAKRPRRKTNNSMSASESLPEEVVVPEVTPTPKRGRGAAKKK